MARRVITELIDDTDGSVADETVTFGLDGVVYEIDLARGNAELLRKSLLAYTDFGRRVSGRVPTQSGPDKVRFAKIRKWAEINGQEVSKRGRIAESVQKAYDESQAAYDN